MAYIQERKEHYGDPPPFLDIDNDYNYSSIVNTLRDPSFTNAFLNSQVSNQSLTGFVENSSIDYQTFPDFSYSDSNETQNYTSLYLYNETAGGGDVDNETVYLHMYIRVVSTFFCGFVIVVGVLGNLLVPIVILKNRDMRNSTNYFLMNLSLADLLVLIVCMPSVLVELHSPMHAWLMGYHMCLLVPYLETTVVHASVLSLVFISLERYHVICRPLQAGYRCTKAKAIVAIATIWTLAAASAGPTLIFQDYQEEPTGPECLFLLENPWAGYYFLAMSVLFFFLPLVLLVILYSVIARQLLIDTYNLTHKKNSPQMRARKQVVIMLSTVVVFFFICLLPLRVFFIWIIESPIETIHSLGNETFYNILWFCRIMYYINSCINPILYNMTSTRFRTAFLRLCGCRRTLQLHEYNSNTSYNNQSMANIRLNYGTNCSLVYKSMYSKSVASQQFSYVSTVSGTSTGSGLSRISNITQESTLPSITDIEPSISDIEDNNSQLPKQKEVLKV